MHKVYSLKEAVEWTQMLDRLPARQRDVYFTPKYYSLYQSYGDGEALCFVFECEGDVALYPFLKNAIKPLGYNLDEEYFDIQGAYGYNGLVSSSYNEAFINAFWNEFDAWCKDNSIVAEFMRFHPLLNNQQIASPKMKIIFSRHTVGLDLSLSLDDIWMHQINSKNRNLIRKAEKEGVRIVESQDYNVFRKLYDGTMTDLHADGYYFFPKTYYDEFMRTFEKNGILCLAMYEDEAIAGSMFMFSDDFGHYHLSARNRAFSKLAANNLLLWYAVQKAKDRGCKWFHFGGGTTGDENDSLLHFKRSFSTTECDFYIGKRVHNQVIYDEIMHQWQTDYPLHYEDNKVKLLGYREIPR